MPNNLIRAGSFSITPAQPGQPYRPAYTVVEYFDIVEVFFTDGVKWVSAKPGPFTPTSYDPDQGPTWYPVGPPGKTLYEVGTTQIAVPRLIPAQEAVPARPEQRVFYPPEGWTAYARSVRTVGNAGARFKIADRSTVAIGLTRLPAPTSGYNHIPRGFLFTGTTVRNLRTNESLGSFTSADTFSLRRVGRELTLLQGEDELAVEELPFGAEEQLFLSAALYGYQNAVLEPELVELSQGGSSAAVLPALRSRSFEGAYEESAAVLPSLAASSGIVNRSAATLSRMAASSADRQYAGSVARFTGLTATSYAGTWAVERPNESQAVVTPLTASSTMLTGGIGQSMTSLAGMQALSADRAYGQSQAVIGLASARSWNWPANRVAMSMVFGVEPNLSGQIVIDVSASFGVGVDFDISATETVDENVLITVGLSVPMTVSTIETADARSIFWFDVPMDVPGAFVDTWVVNTASGGSTRYDNYPFESVANIGGYYVGVSDAGIFELSGDSDDGDPINARVDYGLQRFGSGNLKRLEQIYLGIKSTGQMYVKVTAEGASYTYPLRDFSEYMQTQRVTPGKGMRATYFGFELGNTLGSDFELSSFSTLVAETARRI